MPEGETSESSWGWKEVKWVSHAGPWSSFNLLSYRWALKPSLGHLSPFTFNTSKGSLPHFWRKQYPENCISFCGLLSVFPVDYFGNASENRNGYCQQEKQGKSKELNMSIIPEWKVCLCPTYLPSWLANTCMWNGPKSCSVEEYFLLQFLPVNLSLLWPEREKGEKAKRSS